MKEDKNKLKVGQIRVITKYQSGAILGSIIRVKKINYSFNYFVYEYKETFYLSDSESSRPATSSEIEHMLKFESKANSKIGMANVDDIK